MIIIPTPKAITKLQTSTTNKAIHQLGIMHENCHIFTSFPSCCASVMKQNGNPVTLIKEEGLP